MTSYTTFDDPLGRGEALRRGDMLPWDWKLWGPQDDGTIYPGFELSNRDEFLRRMAPNVFAADGSLIEGAVPALRAGPYFENEPDGGSLVVRDQYQNSPPFGFSNATPLAASMSDLADWYSGWKVLAADEDTGDPSFECRPKYAILVTDGAETCSGNTQAAAQSLFNEGIRTFAIGFWAGGRCWSFAEHCKCWWHRPARHHR